MLRIAASGLTALLAVHCGALAQSLLDVIEVDTQVTTPPRSSYTQLLMEHVFANSYGAPFVGSYEPPPIEFNRVVFNFTVTSAGRQFDRLGVMYFNDTEVFRTSTAEPTKCGIIWTYMKDMSHLLPLFQQPQKIMFDLGNLINDIYTAPFNASLSATFFVDRGAKPTADVILPVSAGLSAENKSSAFVVPDNDVAAISSLTLPQNVKRAVFTVSAVGQAAEEFWWSNVLSSYTETFGNRTELYGFSPFREVQLYIDGNLAGVTWPFPVIFTGGVVPGFWRPLVGIEAFDLREDEIDITPFLSILCDGAEHSFELRVAGISDDGKGNGVVVAGVGSNWVLTGKVFLWLDRQGYVTTGSKPKIIRPPQSGVELISTLDRAKGGTNRTLSYHVSASRRLSISSTIKTSDGVSKVFWRQDLQFQCTGNLTKNGTVQYTDHTNSGFGRSSSGYAKSFHYPFQVFSSFAQDPDSGKLSINATMDRYKDVAIMGPTVFPTGLEAFEHEHGQTFKGSQLQTRQNGTASYLSHPKLKTSTSTGATEQTYDFVGLKNRDSFKEQQRQRQQEQQQRVESNPHALETVDLFSRHVLAVNGTIVRDNQMVGGKLETVKHADASEGKLEYSLAGSEKMVGKLPS